MSCRFSNAVAWFDRCTERRYDITQLRQQLAKVVRALLELRADGVTSVTIATLIGDTETFCNMIPMKLEQQQKEECEAMRTRSTSGGHIDWGVADYLVSRRRVPLDHSEYSGTCMGAKPTEAKNP